MIRLSGKPPVSRASNRSKVKMDQLRCTADLEEFAGSEVVDFLCLCAKPRVIVMGRSGKPFLGCPDYKNCDGKPVDLFLNFSRLPTGASWENGEAVFYRDENGDPCPPPAKE